MIIHIYIVDFVEIILFLLFFGPIIFSRLSFGFLMVAARPFTLYTYTYCAYKSAYIVYVRISFGVAHDAYTIAEIYGCVILRVRTNNLVRTTPYIPHRTTQYRWRGADILIIMVWDCAYIPRSLYNIEIAARCYNFISFYILWLRELVYIYYKTYDYHHIRLTKRYTFI